MLGAESTRRRRENHHQYHRHHHQERGGGTGEERDTHTIKKSFEQDSTCSVDPSHNPLKKQIALIGPWLCVLYGHLSHAVFTWHHGFELMAEFLRNGGRQVCTVLGRSRNMIQMAIQLFI